MSQVVRPAALERGVVSLREEVMPGVRRLLCNNPGPFTFKRS